MAHTRMFHFSALMIQLLSFLLQISIYFFFCLKEDLGTKKKKKKQFFVEELNQNTIKYFILD